VKASRPAPGDFEEAVRFFRAKVPMRKEEWEALEEAARSRAFTVAGVAQLSLVADVHKALEKAIAKGTSLAEFKRDVGAKLVKEWGGEKPGRLETIFRTNVQTAYSAGRMEMLTQPGALKARPYWMLLPIGDDRTSAICKRFIRPPVILPADSPWWTTHIPPMHFRCRTALRALSAQEAKARGVLKAGPPVKPDEGFGGDPRAPVDLLDIQQAKYEEGEKPGWLKRMLDVLRSKQGSRDEKQSKPLKPADVHIRGNAAPEVAERFRRLNQLLGRRLIVSDFEGIPRAMAVVYELDKLPNELLGLLANNKYDIHIGGTDLTKLGPSHTARQLDGKYSDQNPGVLWNNVPGATFGDVREILVRANVDLARTVLHEVGHAIDNLHHVSSEAGFDAMWQEWRRDKGPKKRYYTNEERGRRESFAEAFSLYHSSGYIYALEAFGDDIAQLLADRYPRKRTSKR
jgi:SPP1 gp7 family putative phage head morphogenesis protein